MSPGIPLAFVAGWPVGHSRSPALHGHWLARYGIAGYYVPLPVASEDLETVLRSLPKCGFAGGNVTIPHKETAFALADETTATARRLRAANTLWFDAERGMVADNTDGFGFLENLRAMRPDWTGAEGPAAVLGAGGAARAIVAALVDAGVPELRLVNRTQARAERLAEEIGGPVTVFAMERAEVALDGAALIVNTTSMGMEGGPPLTLDLHGIAAGALATDAVYAPLDTPFLQRARAAGAETVDGLGMLLHQARPGFARWFGREPEVDEALRRAVLG